MADSQGKPEESKVKCVVWDLDNTLWRGVLSEGDRVELSDAAIEVVKALDQRGILCSIASKNDQDTALSKLEELGIRDYFLYPQIHWGAKSSSIAAIAKSFNIALDSLAFVDDQPFELEEVGSVHPNVRCIHVDRLSDMLAMSVLTPRFVTDESARRRSMYLADIERQRVESEHEGPQEEFLATLGMRLTIDKATAADLRRAEELTVRTHQLNTTGYTYSYDELEAFCNSPRHELLVAELTDKYGEYGKIGLVLLEVGPTLWTIKLLLMSCRVMSRGVGSVMIHHLRDRARKAGVALRAEFIPTKVNRMMYMTYKFAHFSELPQQGELHVLENDLAHVQAMPAYLQLITTA